MEGSKKGLGLVGFLWFLWLVFKGLLGFSRVFEGFQAYFLGF